MVESDINKMLRYLEGSKNVRDFDKYRPSMPTLTVRELAHLADVRTEAVDEIIQYLRFRGFGLNLDPSIAYRPEGEEFAGYPPESACRFTPRELQERIRKAQNVVY